MIVVTGATGHLGRHVVTELLKKVPASEIAVAVRSPEKAKADFDGRGIQIRLGDYDKPETFGGALEGATKVLLISASEVGKRVVQHQSVIDAAKKANVSLLAYTSILGGDRNKMKLAAEHQETEARIQSSGLPFTFLRNGWYIENYTERLAGPLEHGVMAGCAGNGRIAAATRADYAAAAAAVLAGNGHANKAYELAGDASFTMPELAAEVSRVSGKTVAYKNVSVADYTRMLVGFGLPELAASVVADADFGITRGELDDASHTLSRLIGRPTTPWKDVVAAALAVHHATTPAGS
jgi:NAD(P)H dehydrogenase (quinone)